MPVVSGRVVLDRDRDANINGDVTGLGGIPVVLQDTVSLNRLIVLTNALGEYEFINVPAGSYRIVEIYGLPGGTPTPGDFSAAVVAAIPPAQVPPLQAVPLPPPGATNVDCVTPNTILATVSTGDIEDQYIFNGAVAYTPLTLEIDPCAIVFSGNLVTDADEGTFGGFTAGTLANTGTTDNPYPDIFSDFTYVVPDPGKYTPIDGEFTIQNTMNNAMSNVIGAWWRISDHTTGNETGRMMIVNENDPGDIIFRTTVAVNANTTYLFSTWIMNLFRVAGYPGPQFAVRILDEDGQIMYVAQLGSEIPVNEQIPEWKEIGSTINSLENTVLTIEFFSQGEAAVGNDFAIDDISLREIQLPQFELIKSEDRSSALIGDIVTYTVTLNNNCGQPLTNILFQDFVPAGLEFVFGSVLINGVPAPTANPLIGVPVPDIPGGGGMQVVFRARAVTVPGTNPAINSASIRYAYTPMQGGIPAIYTLESNDVQLLIVSPVVNADISIVKTANTQAVQRGGTVIYNITVTNNGPDSAENVILSDVLPAGIIWPSYSLDFGSTWQSWIGSYNIGLLTNSEVFTILIKGFISGSAGRLITNTAFVTDTTPDPNPNNSSTVTVVVDNFGASCCPLACRPSACSPVQCECRGGCGGSCRTCRR